MWASGRFAAYPPPFVRHTSRSEQRGYPFGPAHARPRGYLYHPDLHPHYGRPFAKVIRKISSASQGKHDGNCPKTGLALPFSIKKRRTFYSFCLFFYRKNEFFYSFSDFFCR